MPRSIAIALATALGPDVAQASTPPGFDQLVEFCVTHEGMEYEDVFSEKIRECITAFVQYYQGGCGAPVLVNQTTVCDLWRMLSAESRREGY